MILVIYQFRSLYPVLGVALFGIERAYSPWKKIGIPLVAGSARHRATSREISCYASRECN